MASTHRPVLLSTVASDSHTWNLVYLQLLVTELGWHVVNLGPCVPDGTLLDASQRHHPALVLITTVNGHGAEDGERLIRRLRAEPVLASTPVVIGGKLGIDGEEGARLRAQRLLRAGFTAVLEGPGAVPRLRSLLGELRSQTGLAARDRAA